MDWFPDNIELDPMKAIKRKRNQQMKHEIIILQAFQHSQTLIHGSARKYDGKTDNLKDYFSTQFITIYQLNYT